MVWMYYFSCLPVLTTGNSGQDYYYYRVIFYIVKWVYNYYRNWILLSTCINGRIPSRTSLKTLTQPSKPVLGAIKGLDKRRVLNFSSDPNQTYFLFDPQINTKDNAAFYQGCMNTVDVVRDKIFAGRHASFLKCPPPWRPEERGFPVPMPSMGPGAARLIAAKCRTPPYPAPAWNWRTNDRPTTRSTYVRESLLPSCY